MKSNISEDFDISPKILVVSILVLVVGLIIVGQVIRKLSYNYVQSHKEEYCVKFDYINSDGFIEPICQKLWEEKNNKN